MRKEAEAVGWWRLERDEEGGRETASGTRREERDGASERFHKVSHQPSLLLTRFAAKGRALSQSASEASHINQSVGRSLGRWTWT